MKEPDPLFPDEMHARRFSDVCAWLASWFNVLPLDQALVAMGHGQLPARAACITFDDGYADNYNVAMPILRKHGLTSTFFIATGFLDGGRMWNDTLIETVRLCERPELDLSPLGLPKLLLHDVAARRAAIELLISEIKYRSIAERVAMSEAVAGLASVRPPSDLMLTSDELRAMRDAGMQIGAHTVDHPILARLEDDEALRQIADSKRFLEDLLGQRIGLFAYPNGKPGEDYSPRSVELVRALGFDAAVSTRWGTSAKGDDLFQICRFTPWDHGRSRFGLRLAANLRSM